MREKEIRKAQNITFQAASYQDHVAVHSYILVICSSLFFFSLFVPDYLLYARYHCIAFDAATVIGYQQKTVFNLSRLGAYNNSNNNGFNR